MTMSQAWRSSAACMAAAVSTRSDVTSYPARRNTRSSKSASSSKSSTSSTRNGIPMPASLHRWRLVQDEPVKSELAYRFDELDEVHRFSNITIAAKTVAINEILLFLRRGEHDHWGKLGPFIGAETADHLQAVDLGQLEVQE